MSADGLGTVYHKAGDKVATIVTNDKGIARIDAVSYTHLHFLLIRI